MDLRGSQVASIYTLRVESRPKKGSVEAGEVRADIGVLCLRLTWGQVMELTAWAHMSQALVERVAGGRHSKTNMSFYFRPTWWFRRGFGPSPGPLGRHTDGWRAGPTSESGLRCVEFLFFFFVSFCFSFIFKIPFLFQSQIPDLNLNQIFKSKSICNNKKTCNTKLNFIFILFLSHHLFWQKYIQMHKAPPHQIIYLESFIKFQKRKFGYYISSPALDL